MKFSICMMVKNEEKNLERCLISLIPLINQSDVELIIVDTGSEDDTINIAKKYTDKVYFHEWNNNFSDMRNKTISYAKGKWIFIIDADEELVDPDKLIRLINSTEMNKYNTIIFQVKSFNDLNNSDIAALNPSPRIFKNDGKFRYLGAVHNQPVYKKPIKVSNIMLNHYGYILEDKELMDKKFNRTKTILEKELVNNPNNVYYQFQLGVTYDMHGDYKDSYREFKKAYNMLKTPQDKKERIYIYSSFARSASLNRMYQEVIEICREGIELRKDFIDLYYILAVAKRQVGDYENSISQFEVYLDLINNFQNLEISKELSISLYNMDEASIESAYLNLFSNCIDIGDYLKAKQYIPFIKDTMKKIHCYASLLSYTDLEEELVEIYNEIDLKYKNEFCEIIENKIESLDEEKQNKIRTAFGNGDDIYSFYNKIILREDIRNKEVYNTEILEFIDKVDLNNTSDYLGRFIYSLMKNKGNVYTLLNYVYQNNIERLIKYCYLKFEDMETITKEYVNNNEFFNKNNIEHLRISKILLSNLLLYNKNKEEYMDIFNVYINIGKNYINSIYKDEVIENEMIYNMKEDDTFILLASKAEEIRKTDIKQCIQYLRKGLGAYPVFKDYVEMLNKEIKKEIDTEENDSGMEEMKKQVKDNIEFLINEGSLEEAKALLVEYFKMVQNDTEAYSMKSIIAIMEGKFDEGERILKDGLALNGNNFDLNYNLAYVYEQQGEYLKALETYEKIVFNMEECEQRQEIIKYLNNLEFQHKDIIQKQLQAYKYSIQDNKDKDKKINLHLMYDSPFCNKFIEYVNKTFDKSEHKFVVIASKHQKIQFMNLDGVENAEFLDLNTDLNTLLCYIDNCSKLFIHYLFDYFCKLVCIFDINVPIYWALWGGDLYNYIDFTMYDDMTREILINNGVYSNENVDKDQIEYIYRKSAIRKISYVLTDIEGDYTNIKENFLTDAKRLPFLYSNAINSNIFQANKGLNKGKYNLKGRFDYVILAGNSGSPTNNHIEILKKLKEIKSKEFCVVMPLSYGGSIKYVEEVIRKGRELLGNQYIPLTEFLDPEDYFNLLRQVDTGIFNNNRQQGVGNMISLLYLGKKIYLKNNTSTFSYLSNMGIEIYDITNINTEDMNQMVNIDEDTGLRNKMCIEMNLGHDRYFQYMNDIFSNS